MIKGLDKTVNELKYILKDLGYFCLINLISMGRYSTGAISTSSAQRLELSYLLRHGSIKKGQFIHGSLNWTNGNNISFISELTEKNQYIRLIYTHTSNYSGEVNKMDYKIQLVSIPSNLGKGKIYYFRCPVSGRRSRILYMCYGSLYFKSRLAYRKRIFYPSQISSKLNFHNDRYWEIERLLEKLNKEANKSSYKGKPTRLKKRIAILEEKKNYHDDIRWNIFPKAAFKELGKMGF